jgi:hypothetical protein
LHMGALIRDLDHGASWSSIAVLRGEVNGSTMAFNCASTVLLSLPCSCHMPSRRCVNSRYRWVQAVFPTI